MQILKLKITLILGIGFILLIPAASSAQVKFWCPRWLKCQQCCLWRAT